MILVLKLPITNAIAMKEIAREDMNGSASRRHSYLTGFGASLAMTVLTEPRRLVT